MVSVLPNLLIVKGPGLASKPARGSGPDSEPNLLQVPAVTVPPCQCADSKIRAQGPDLKFRTTGRRTSGQGTERAAAIAITVTPGLRHRERPGGPEAPRVAAETGPGHCQHHLRVRASESTARLPATVRVAATVRVTTVRVATVLVATAERR